LLILKINKTRILAFINGKIANRKSKIANKKIPNLSIQDFGAQLDFPFQLQPLSSAIMLLIMLLKFLIQIIYRRLFGLSQKFTV